MDRHRFVLLSPVLVILVGSLTIRLAARSLGVWAWVPWVLVYWALICVVVFWGVGKAAVTRWMRPPHGRWLWSAVPFVLVLPAIPMFISSWQLLKPVYVWVPSLIFIAVNPVLEEWYWRGTLLDATSTWPSWIAIPATSVLFSLDHLWSKGVISLAERNPVFLIYAFVFGVVFGIVYKKTGSLRWPIVAHAFADLFGLSVAVFLNLWVPPVR